jgi:hypothetical protein
MSASSVLSVRALRLVASFACSAVAVASAGCAAESEPAAEAVIDSDVKGAKPAVVVVSVGVEPPRRCARDSKDMNLALDLASARLQGIVCVDGRWAKVDEVVSAARRDELRVLAEAVVPVTEKSCGGIGTKLAIHAVDARGRLSTRSFRDARSFCYPEPIVPAGAPAALEALRAAMAASVQTPLVLR